MIITGDSLQVLKMYPDGYFDSVVTDPPYGLKFMGHRWDCDVPSVELWAECLRVLKPGGYLAAFAGTRTQHRMACRIEDAGFEIRDMIAWLYGSGFPKHRSALKPALEPITLARKPAPRATLLRIEDCRVPAERATGWGGGGSALYDGGLSREQGAARPVDGRYPANLVHDGSPEVLALFPDSAGCGGSVPQTKVTGYGATSEYLGGERTPFDSGSGSAARFFYCCKASRTERDAGLEGFALQRCGGMQATADASMLTGAGNPRTTTRRNTHPTVKPIELMRWLARLITPEGGRLLDPFAGSGSTLCACQLEGIRGVGIELDPHHAAIARAREAHYAK